MTARNYEELLRRIDGAAGGRVIVYGSLPPDARDLDLLVGPDDAAAIGRSLREDGFTEWNRSFVAFRSCTVLVVELIPAASLGVSRNELSALSRDAVPIGELENVAEPSPHHILLILARRLARERVLRPKHRARIDRALALDPEAWQRAHDRARLWTGQAALSRLRSLYERRGEVDRQWRWSPRRPRRTRVIVLIGADRDRTRSHADSLRDTLGRLGFDARVEDPPAVRASRFRDVRAAWSAWRPIWRRLGRGTVLIYDLSPLPGHRSARSVSLVSPKPLRSYVVDARRPRAEVCEELAEDAWRALVHRTRLEITARKLLMAIRELRPGRVRSPAS
jgi:hypothetical protein